MKSSETRISLFRLVQETLRVVGVNYAKNPGEAQINYVIPIWKLLQVLRKHNETGGGQPSHSERLRLVEVGLLAVDSQRDAYRGLIRF